jgi:Ser/Thr protein kinase RdoA (MazF antagonist)
MKTVELAGPIGAGKSAVTERLRNLLAERGCSAFVLRELEPRRGRRAAMLAFALRHPALLGTVLRSVLAASIPWWHRRRILSLVLDLGARLDMAGRRLPADAWLLVDEGWAHRAVNVFAWRDPPAMRSEIKEYLRRAPISGTVVIVNAPPELASARALRRGLPKRLHGAGVDRTERFMRDAAAVIGVVADELASAGQAVVRIENSGDLEETVARLAGELDEQGSTTPPASAGAVIFRPRLPTLPRPDRVARRVRARGRTRRLAPVALARVLDSYGLPADTRIHPTRSPGGRGISFKADAPGGPLLVKRYKANVEAATIREEHSVLVELARGTVPVPRLYPATDGETLVQVDGSHYAAFEYLDGYHHPHERLMWPADRRAFEAAAGESLGAFHAALDGFEPAGQNPNGFAGRAGGRVRGLPWFMDRIAPLAPGSDAPARDDPTPAERAWVADELQHIDTRLERADLPRAVIHGDYGPYNLLLRSGEALVIIDLELSRVDWRLTDLATAIPRFAGRRVGFERDAGRRFLDGYRRRRELRGEELAFLPDVLAFLSLRRAIVCWSRARDGDARRWHAEAERRVRLARSLLAGTHPIVELAAG